MKQNFEAKKRKYRRDYSHAKVPKACFSIVIEKSHSIEKHCVIINNDTYER